MNYAEDEVSEAIRALDKYKGAAEAEVDAALAVVWLCIQRTAKEIRIRDDMIRVAHRSGASIRQLADVSGLGRKTITAIVGAGR